MEPELFSKTHLTLLPCWEIQLQLILSISDGRQGTILETRCHLTLEHQGTRRHPYLPTSLPKSYSGPERQQ